MEIFLSVIIAVIVVALAAVSVASFYKFFKKFSALLLCSALLFGIIVYAFGYWDMDYTVNAFSVLTVALQSIFSSARFFIFDSDYSLLVNERVISNIVYMFFFSLSAIYTMFAMTTTVLSLFASRALMSGKLYVSKARRVYIFIGVSEEVLALAFDTKACDSKSTVIIIDKKSAFDSDMYNRCYAGRIILFNKADHRANTLYVPKAYYKRLLRDKCRVHIVVSADDEVTNAETAIDLLTNCDISGKYAILSCNTDSVGKENIFDAINSTNWEIRLFSDKEIIVRKLLKEHSVIRYLDVNKAKCTVNSAPEIFVAGSALDKELLTNIIREAQFDEVLPNITVWSENADKLGGMLNMESPQIYKCANIKYIAKKEFTTDFYGFLCENSMDYVVFATDDYTENINNANIYSMRSGRDVFAFVRDEKWREMATSSSKNTIAFGLDRDIYTYSSIICGETDRAGRAVNMYYNGGVDDYYKKSIFDKKANDAFGYNIPLKLAFYDLEICDSADKDAMSSNEFKELVAPNLDYLARQEHARWNAFYYTNGYCTWRLEDIPNDWKTTKDVSRKLHSCLVSYDELDDVSARFKDKVANVPFGYKGYDMMLVESIVEILNYCNLSVKKVNKGLNS